MRTFLQGLSDEERKVLLGHRRGELGLKGKLSTDEQDSHASTQASCSALEQRQQLLQERAQRHKLEAQVAALQAAVSEQTSLLHQLQSDREEMRRQSLQSAERGFRVKALEQENVALSAKLGAAANERKLLMSKVQSMQERISELQQSYVSLASCCDDGLDRRDILRRSKVEGMLREAAAGGALDAELAQQAGAGERSAFTKVSNALAAVTRERDLLQQRVQELSDRLSEAVGREGAARGAQALRNASWKRSAVQAEARLAAALKRIKDLGDELRKRDAEARARDRYIAQLERTVMAQHKSLQQQRRLLKEGGQAGPDRGGQEGHRSLASSGPQAAEGAPASRGGIRSAVPSTALRVNPGAAGGARIGSDSVGTYITWPMSSQAEAGQPSTSQRNDSGAPGPAAQAQHGTQSKGSVQGGRHMEPDSPTGGDFQRFLAASLARINSRASVSVDDADTDPWSPQHFQADAERLSAEHQKEQVRDRDCKEPHAAGVPDVAPGADSVGAPLEAWPSNTEEQARHGRSATPPAVLHQQLSSVEASLAQLYRDLEEFKDISRQQDPDPGSPVPPPTRLHRRSLLRQLSDEEDAADRRSADGDRSARGTFPASLPSSPKRRPYGSARVGYDSADDEQLLAASRLLPREESPEHTFSTSNDQYAAGYGDEDGYNGLASAEGSALSLDEEARLWVHRDRPEAAARQGGEKALSSSAETAQRSLPIAPAAGRKHLTGFVSHNTVPARQDSKNGAGDSRAGTADSSVGQHQSSARLLDSNGEVQSGSARREADEEQRQPLPTHMLGHVLCCALPSPRGRAMAATAAAGPKRTHAATAAAGAAGAAAGSGVATLQQLLRPGAAVERGPTVAGQLSAREASSAASPRAGRAKAGTGSGARQVAGASTVRGVRFTQAAGPASGTPGGHSQCGSAPGSRSSYALQSTSRSSGLAGASASARQGPASGSSRAPVSTRAPMEDRNGSSTKGHWPRSSLRAGRDQALQGQQAAQAGSSAGSGCPSRRNSEPITDRVDTDGREDALPGSPEALSPIATLLAHIDSRPTAEAPSVCRSLREANEPRDTEQARSRSRPRDEGPPAADVDADAGEEAVPTDEGSSAAQGRHGAKRRSHDGVLEGTEDKRRARAGSGDGSVGAWCSAGTREQHGAVDEAGDDGVAGLETQGDCSPALAGEPSFSHSHARFQSGGSTQRSSIRHSSSQAVPRSSVASNSVAASQGLAAESDGAVCGRPTLSGWLASPRAHAGRPLTGDSQPPSVRRRDIDNAASALQRLRDQRLQRHQQPQQTPRPAALPQKAPARSAEPQQEREAGQERGDAPPSSSARASAEQEAGVMVLTLRGSMHGEVLISPRQLAEGGAAMLPVAGRVADGGGGGSGDASGLTLRLEVSSRPPVGQASGAAHGGQRPLQTETSLQALRDALRLKDAGAITGAGAQTPDGSGATPVSDMGSLLSGVPRGDGALGHMRMRSGDGPSGLRGSIAGSVPDKPSLAKHPLMQLLGQASADLQLLNDRLKPLVGDRN